MYSQEEKLNAVERVETYLEKGVGLVKACKKADVNATSYKRWSSSLTARATEDRFSREVDLEFLVEVYKRFGAAGARKWLDLTE